MNKREDSIIKMNWYEDSLVAEKDSWLLGDEYSRWEKIHRERMRHYKLIKDLLLDKMGTPRMHILEIGGGPCPVSDLLEYQSRIVVDPLSDQYKKYWPCPDHVNERIEDWQTQLTFDLIICTNALDHVKNPQFALHQIKTHFCRPGGFVAIICAENNALTNPHPAHVHNLTPKFIHKYLDPEFETVHELTYKKDGYRYGHVLYEGKRGQPAFAMLMRKCSGYAK